MTKDRRTRIEMTKEQFIFSTIRPMAEYTFPYLTSVIGIKDVSQGEHVGSGLRAIWPESLTASELFSLGDGALGARRSVIVQRSG